MAAAVVDPIVMDLMKQKAIIISPSFCSLSEVGNLSFSIAFQGSVWKHSV